MQHMWNTLPNIYCHPELRFLHCIAFLCDCIKKDSQVQGGCYRIAGTLQICKMLKPGEKVSRWRNNLPMSPLPRCTVCCNLIWFYFDLDLTEIGIPYSQHSQSWWVAITGMSMN